MNNIYPFFFFTYDSIFSDGIYGQERGEEFVLLVEYCYHWRFSTVERYWGYALLRWDSIPGRCHCIDLLIEPVDFSPNWIPRPDRKVLKLEDSMFGTVAGKLLPEKRQIFIQPFCIILFIRLLIRTCKEGSGVSNWGGISFNGSCLTPISWCASRILGMRFVSKLNTKQNRKIIS